MRREANYAFEEGFFFFFFSRDRLSSFFFSFVSFLLFPSRYHRDSCRKVRVMVHRAKGWRNDRLEEETRFPAADRSANEPEGNL